MRAFVKNRSSGAGWRHLLVAGSIWAVALVEGLVVFCAPALAAPTFQEAVADYNSGKYPRALATLQAVNASYPNNPMVHYYMALSQQSMGHLEHAKAEFRWVIGSRDPRLAPMATVGLAQLAGAKTTGSGSGASYAVVNSSESASASGGGQKLAAGKIKKVLEFWATW